MERGFRFTEAMSGTFALTAAPTDQRPLSLTIEAQAVSWLDYLRTGKTDLRGTLEAEGFADGVPIQGRLLLLPLTKRLIRFAFNFTGNDGNPYRFAGQKRIRLLEPLKSFTELPGAIYDRSGREVATTRTRFNLRRDLVSFLSSWRLA